MESKLIEAAVSQGPWAILFVTLFLYTVKDARRREGKYQDVIAKLSDIINIDIKEIKEAVKDFCCRKDV